jgi:predicted nucleic acid-binding protein
MNADRTFVDTNVLVYSVDRHARAKQKRALALLLELGASLVISTQVMQEFYVTATRKLPRPLSPAEADDHIERLARTDVVVVDVPLIRMAISLSREHRLALWDALIVESARARGCSRLLTEDLQDGHRFGSLRVENPFAGL